MEHPYVICSPFVDVATSWTSREGMKEGLGFPISRINFNIGEDHLISTRAVRVQFNHDPPPDEIKTIAKIWLKEVEQFDQDQLEINALNH
jgi:hypothetical protein